MKSSCCLWSATGLELRYKSQRCGTSAPLPLSNSKNKPSCSKTEATKPPSNSCAPTRPSTLTARKGSSTSEARALSMYVTYRLKLNTTQNHSTSNSKMDPPSPSCSKVKRTMKTCTSANHTSKWTTPTWTYHFQKHQNSKPHSLVCRIWIEDIFLWKRGNRQKELPAAAAGRRRIAGDTQARPVRHTDGPGVTWLRRQLGRTGTVWTPRETAGGWEGPHQEEVQPGAQSHWRRQTTVLRWSVLDWTNQRPHQPQLGVNRDHHVQTRRTHAVKRPSLVQHHVQRGPTAAADCRPRPRATRRIHQPDQQQKRVRRCVHRRQSALLPRLRKQRRDWVTILLAAVQVTVFELF